jgi:Rha family phage regulatory protein
MNDATSIIVGKQSHGGGGMPQLEVNNGRVMVTSLELAERFQKRHDNVLRDIDRIASQIATERLLNFEVTFRQVAGPNGTARNERLFLLTRDGFSVVAMGFTGPAALDWKFKYIEAFNRMEAALREQALQASQERMEATARQAAREVAAESAASDRRLLELYLGLGGRRGMTAVVWYALQQGEAGVRVKTSVRRIVQFAGAFAGVAQVWRALDELHFMGCIRATYSEDAQGRRSTTDFALQSEFVDRAIWEGQRALRGLERLPALPVAGGQLLLGAVQSGFALPGLQHLLPPAGAQALAGRMYRRKRSARQHAKDTGIQSDVNHAGAAIKVRGARHGV